MRLQTYQHPFVISDTMVRHVGKTEVERMTSLFRGYRFEQKKMFAITEVHFAINIDNGPLLLGVISSLFFIIVVGRMPLLGCPVSIACRRPLALSKPIIIDHQQHFSVDVEFRGLDVLRCNSEDNEHAFVDLSVDQYCLRKDKDKEDIEVLRLLNESTRLKSIECSLSGVTEEEV